MPETIEAINACKENNVKLMTALQRRFDPNFARVKIAIADGEVGEVIQVGGCVFLFSIDRANWVLPTGEAQELDVCVPLL